ncbi:MAG: Fur family transcriptional regulator [Pyrinomonadaceae bacterium]|jgi:Fe2+ or Zn2+ uptake regulation protein
MTTHTRSQIESQMRAAGLKLTPQRFAVLDYLSRSSAHPTAEQIRIDLNRRFPRASRATVYNTLNALCRAGFVNAIYLDDAVGRYEAVINSHHHFVCRACGHIEDVPVEHVRALPQKGLRANRKVENYEIVMRGICDSCDERTTD